MPFGFSFSAAKKAAEDAANAAKKAAEDAAAALGTAII